jgi:hypothetical protein
MTDGKGKPRSALDTIIAAVAEANGCVVVTDNEKTVAPLGNLQVAAVFMHCSASRQAISTVAGSLCQKPDSRLAGSCLWQQPGLCDKLTSISSLESP